MLTGVETFTCTIPDGTDTAMAQVEVTVDETIDPMPVLLANGVAEDLTVGRGERVTLDVMLRAGAAMKQLSDYWVAVRTPFAPPGDWYHFAPGMGWNPGLVVTFQGPCIHLKTYRVLDMKLPPGRYIFYFGIDPVMNGVPDMKLMSYATLVVNVK